MKERPILFSAPMVRAILEGRKTQTRRVIKVQPTNPAQRFGTCVEDTGRKHEGMHHWIDPKNTHNQTSFFRCPYGQPGDRLWVRETFAISAGTGGDVFYKADGRSLESPWQWWKPSIHMPRAASRITLEITAVRVERLQDISEADAMAEGLCKGTKDKELWKVGLADWPWTDWVWGAKAAINAYAKLWQSINGPGSWEANPWVWVIEFKVL